MAQYKGPLSTRVIKDISFVEFINQDAADRVVKSIKDQNLRMLNGSGAAVKIDKLKTRIQKTRWYNLEKAEELVTADAKARGQNVTLDPTMPIRKILVNGQVAFEQERDDVVGVFKNEFTHLHIE